MLLGGGHSHVAVLKSQGEAPTQHTRLTLISAKRHTLYSGMLPGLIAGHYEYLQCRIDLEHLAGYARAEFLEMEAVALDAAERLLLLADGRRIEYDVLSIDIGSTPPAFGIPGVPEQVIPAKPIEVTKTVTRQVSSTGQGEGGGKAGGDITVTNSLPRNQSLVTQTRFQSPDGRIFRAQSGVVVPAGGQTTAHVVADDGGAAGNLPAGTKLSIPGLHATTAVSGQVDTALTGGTDSNATTVSKADADRAKQELAAQAAREGIADAKSKLAVGYQLDPKIAATSVLDSSVNPPAGTVAPKFTVSGRVKVTYFTYQAQDFKNVLDPDLNAKVPAGAELVDQRTETFAATQTSENQLTGTMTVDTFAATNVSKEKVREAVHGKNPADAKAALESDGQITSVRIALFPFWVLSVPGSLDKFEIHFESGTSGAGTLPTPAVSPGNAAASPSL